MRNKRRAERRMVNLGVKKIVDGESYPCKACEISATGIRLSLETNENPSEPLVELELPLVEGQLTTQVTARQVWSNSSFEAFEFIGPSFAQQTILQRVFCGC
jgi:hypothetical protein